jgi:hypothetical protein
MIINIGEKHKGSSVVDIMLEDPGYVNWLMQETDATGQLRVVRNEMLRLIGIFNSKPFIQKCWGNNHNCGKTATRCTAYKEDYQGLYWWCDSCNPYQNEARSGKLHIISTYRDVLEYVYMVLNNRSQDSAALIKKIAHEKGLPKRAKKGDIDKFFLEKGILTF